ERRHAARRRPQRDHRPQAAAGDRGDRRLSHPGLAADAPLLGRAEPRTAHGRDRQLHEEHGPRRRVADAAATRASVARQHRRGARRRRGDVRPPRRQRITRAAGLVYAPASPGMNDALSPVARGSATLVWTLVARSIGLAAGVAIVLLVAAALLRV